MTRVIGRETYNVFSTGTVVVIVVVVVISVLYLESYKLRRENGDAIVVNQHRIVKYLPSPAVRRNYYNLCHGSLPPRF